jgi:hypothetical protein
MAIWSTFGYILWEFDVFCGDLVYFSHFGMFYQAKSGNPGCANRIFAPFYSDYTLGTCIIRFS